MLVMCWTDCPMTSSSPDVSPPSSVDSPCHNVTRISIRSTSRNMPIRMIPARMISARYSRQKGRFGEGGCSDIVGLALKKWWAGLLRAQGRTYGSEAVPHGLSAQLSANSELYRNRIQSIANTLQVCVTWGAFLKILAQRVPVSLQYWWGVCSTHRSLAEYPLCLLK